MVTTMSFELPILFAAGDETTTDMIFKVVKWTIAGIKFLVGGIGLYSFVWMMQQFGRRSFARRSEERQFTDEICSLVDRRQFEQAEQLASAPKVFNKSTAIMARYAIQNRHLPHNKLQHLLGIRLESEVMAGVEESVTTMNTCIKTAPMLGLFGTVVAMIGAFGKISGQTSPDASKLGGDIALALYATAGGLFIAVVLLLLANYALVRKRRVEDLAINNTQQILTHLDNSVAQMNGAAHTQAAVRVR
jgi:biopolymer transport protein ExbB/TolQ